MVKPMLSDPPDPPDPRRAVPLSRRDFLAAALVAPAALRQATSSGAARYVGAVPLAAPGATSPPFGRLLGDGLDARMFTDLSQLVDPQSSVNQQLSPVTPTDRFFVRTAASSALPALESWTIHLAGLVQSPRDVRLRELEPHAAPPLRALLECSGNADPLNYGLLSTADWEGIPVTAVLDRMQPSAPSTRVLVSGIDDASRQWRTSVAGASWIFSRDDLSRALLVTRMNGAALPRDHGAPLRLLVPG